MTSLQAEAPPFPYAGPQALRVPIAAALGRVIDPEVAMTIVDLWHELARVVPASLDIDVDLVREPPWTAERMADRARRIMGW